VARAASRRGWEEAGASWSDAAAEPARASSGRVLTAATKDLALILRDRGRLLTLVSMPIIFVGVQLFGAAGWSWSTATLERVAHLAFSLTLYMVTIGPLAHMQAERRAFWIMRTVPVSVGRLLAAKAKAWSLVTGGLALLAFGVLSLGTPDVALCAWVGWALVVVAGAVGMSWLAIALAAGSADLSDEQRPAVGPATIYTFLFVGGLYNVVLAGDPAARARGFVLYAFAIAAYWEAGARRAADCLDAEAVRARALTLGDGASFVIALALGERAAALVGRLVSDGDPLGALVAQLVVAALVGLVAAIHLGRRPAGRARLGLGAALGLAVAVGVAGGALARAQGSPPPAFVRSFLDHPLSGLPALGLLLAEELVLRGVVQRSVEEALLRGGAPGGRAEGIARLGGAAASVALGIVAAGLAGRSPLGILLVFHAAPSLTRAVTGRLSAACLARIVAALAAAAFARPFW
jgi:hypothetical protein